jgi:hypothetical protein
MLNIRLCTTRNIKESFVLILDTNDPINHTPFHKPIDPNGELKYNFLFQKTPFIVMLYLGE